MKSSSGVHFIALDHIRALAAFMVCTWHFTHGGGAIGYPVSFDYTPAVFPFALLNEGHTGVALFMTLSGYLFSKLLDGKSINYGVFLWNRAVRLLPLLVLVIVLVGLTKLARGEEVYRYVESVLKGIVYPTLPNGGWSITVEAHYYLVLPAFLWMLKKSRFLPLALIVLAILIRLALYAWKGEIQSLGYWTIIGRVDQFALGMIAYRLRSIIAHRHTIAIGVATAFSLFYWYFDSSGGFYQSPAYPSPRAIWIFLPTIEAVAYGTFICWYDTSFTFPPHPVSRFIGQMGEFSYSIYLFHFFSFSRRPALLTKRSWIYLIFTSPVYGRYCFSWRFIRSVF